MISSYPIEREALCSVLAIYEKTLTRGDTRWEVLIVTKMKIFSLAILFLKLLFSLIITLPMSGIYFCSIFHSLVLVFVGNNNVLKQILFFGALYILHVVLIMIYSFGNKNLCKIFGIGVVVLLTVDVIGFAFMIPNMFAIIGMLIDIVCAFFVVISFIDKQTEKTGDESLS